MAGARRQVLPYRAADGTIVYLAHLLHAGGVTDDRVILAHDPPVG